MQNCMQIFLFILFILDEMQLIFSRLKPCSLSILLVLDNVAISIKYLAIYVPSGVHCVELTQTDSIVLSPGQVLTLSCKISGYSVTDSSYCTDFIRQPAGKALEWVGVICGDGNTYYSDKLKSRVQVTRESSSSTVTLQGQNMQTEDTAVYYCARYMW